MRPHPESMKRPLALVAVAIVTVLALAACGSTSGQSGSGGKAGSGGRLVLGFTGTLSGANASYALQMRQGVNLAVSQLNSSGGISGQKLKVISADDEGSPQNGPVVARQFCQNNAIRAVLGYSDSSVALAAAPVFAECQLPVVASAVTSPNLSGINPYFFRTVPTDALQGAQMGEYVVKTLGIKRVATIYQNDDYGQGGDKAFVNAVRRAGGTVVSANGYDPATTDFSTTLSKIKGTDAQALYIDAFYPFAAKVAQQAKRIGMRQRLIGTDGSLSPQLSQLAGNAVKGMLLYGVFEAGASPQPSAKRFESAFKAKYGQSPSSWSALAYDAVYAIKDAASNGGTSRSDIAHGLPHVHFQGSTGTVAFDAKGDRTAKITILQVRHGKFMLAPKQLAGSTP